MPNMDVLGSLVRDLHESLSQLYYLLLPIGIILSVVVGFLKSGDPNYPDVLKRALVASLLLASFPETSNLILEICDGIAARIDNMQGLETFLRMAQEKSQSYSQSSISLVLKIDDLIIALLSYGSFMLLLVSRYISVALYYFIWVLLSILSPLMILAYIFPSTSGITKNLYRGLMEVAAWKIIWAVLSAMLTSLSFGNIYRSDGSYLTLIVLNFVIALAMLCTPLVMKSLIGDGVQAMAQSLGMSAAMSAVTLPVRMTSIKNAMLHPRSFIDSHIKTYDRHNNSRR